MLEKAYDKGWFDGYEDLAYQNPYDEITEPELWKQYDEGFGEGCNDS